MARAVGVILDALKKSVGPQEIQALAVSLMKNRNEWGEQALALFCRTYLNAYNNFNYDINSNGETMLMDRLRILSLKTVFDVGANIGDWSLSANAHFPLARIYAFELVPTTYSYAATRLAGLSNISVHNFGLSDRDDSIDVNVYSACSPLSSIFEYPHGTATKIKCPVRRADNFIRRHGINHLDFLKVDVEGAEKLVFDGFGEFLSGDFIDTIQFEYGKISIINHILLRDYYSFLYERGFSVGKLYPDCVEFRDYTLDDEDFLGPNYVAVSNKRRDLIEMLKHSSPK